MSDAQTDYRIMLARTRASRRGATPLEVQIQVQLLHGDHWSDVMPTRARMAMREAVVLAGSKVHAYTEVGVTVAVGEDYARLRSVMLAHGFELYRGGLAYFPLGTDKPADHLRHQDGRSWLFAQFEYVGCVVSHGEWGRLA